MLVFYTYKRVNTNNKISAMELIKLYTIKRNIQKFLMFTGLFFLLFGLTLLIYFLYIGFDTNFPRGDWNSIIFTLQGALFFAAGHSQLRYERYFIEWGSTKLRYLLPKDKVIQTINLSDIIDLKINNNTVIINSKEKEITINLKNIEYHKLKRIKKKFKEIKLEK